MPEDTKVCPYCAETIKAAAVVCRFCDRDLLEGDVSKMSPLETAAEVQKRKSRNLLKFAIAAPFILVCMCMAWAVFGSRPPEYGGAGVATPTPAPDISPPFAEIAEKYNSLTDAQWEEYAATLNGTYVDEWEGVVSQVDAGEILGGYSIIIDAGDDSFLPEVSMVDVPEALALSLDKDQKVVFSGVIKYASNSVGLGIYLDGKTVTIDSEK